MKILIISQYFPPEIGAGSRRAFETANILSNLGHEISLITSFPNYLINKSIKKYEGKIFLTENIHGIKIYRCYVYSAFGQTSLYNRFISFLSFMLSSIFCGLILQKYDIIIATSPPLSIGVTGLVLSIFKKTKLVFEVRDIYPKSAISMGVIKNRFLIKILMNIEKAIYNRSELIVGVTDGIYQYLTCINYGKKSFLLTNGIDSSFINNVDHNIDNSLLSKFSDKFILLNIGILGRIHSLETMIYALSRIKVKEIVLVFIGDGAEKGKLKELVNRLKLVNVFFIQSQDSHFIPQIISNSDICLSTVRNIDLTKGTLPVKIFEYMACGKPIVAAIHGEAGKMIKKAKCGIIVEPENSKEMAEGILELYYNKDLRKKMANNGREYVNKHFLRENLIAEYEKKLLTLIP